MSATENSRRAAVDAGTLPGRPQSLELPARLNQWVAALLILGLSVLLWSLIGTAIGWLWG